MTNESGSLLHQQGVTVMGLLTGFMMTALVLILGSPGAFSSPIGPLSGAAYFQVLCTYVGLVGVVSIVGIVAMTEVGTGYAQLGSMVDKFGYTCFLVSLYGFTGALPLLLAPFTKVGSIVVLLVAVVLFLAYVSLGGFGRSARA